MIEFIKTAAKIIAANTGIEVGVNRHHLLLYYFEKRLSELKITNNNEYLQLIENKNSEEFSKLISTVTVNETFFFRHINQFNFFRTLLINRVESKPFEPVTIWSAACAAGPEAYSLAMIASEFTEKYGANIKILATDIDRNELELAKNGIYSGRAVTIEMPYEYLQKNFDKVDLNYYSVKQDIKKLVEFREHNLHDSSYPNGPFDFIFCRNALIYFNDENQQKIKIKFYNSLKKNGYLFLSPSECLFDFSEYYIPENNDTGIKAFKKWTTDRRFGEDRRMLPGDILERRKPIAVHGFPELNFSSNNTIEINGILHGEENRLNKLKLNLSTLIEKKIDITDSPAYYNLDLSGVGWISNEALGLIKSVIVKYKAKEIKLNNIICDNEILANWLRVSGLNKLSYNYSIVKKMQLKESGDIIMRAGLYNKPGFERILKCTHEKSAEISASKNYNPEIKIKYPDTANNKYKKTNEKQGSDIPSEKNKQIVYKIKAANLSTENEIKFFFKKLLDYYQMAEVKIEIDFSELDIINISPYFHKYWSRFCNTFKEQKDRIFVVNKIKPGNPAKQFSIVNSQLYKF